MFEAVYSTLPLSSPSLGREGERGGEFEGMSG